MIIFYIILYRSSNVFGVFRTNKYRVLLTMSSKICPKFNWNCTKLEYFEFNLNAWEYYRDVDGSRIRFIYKSFILEKKVNNYYWIELKILWYGWMKDRVIPFFFPIVYALKLKKKKEKKLSRRTFNVKSQ